MFGDLATSAITYDVLFDNLNSVIILAVVISVVVGALIYAVNNN